MKLLIIAPIKDQQVGVESLRSYVHLFAYNVVKELTSRSDIECVIDNIPFKLRHRKQTQELLPYFESLPVGEYDHILSLGLQSLNRCPQGTYQTLKSKVRPGGKVCQFYDAGKKKNPNCDLMFVHRKHNLEYTKNYYVNWAADPALFTLDQDDSCFTCFIDHPEFKDRLMDRCYFNKILFRVKQLYDSKIWQERYTNFRVYCLTNSGLTEMAMDEVSDDIYDTRPILYNRGNGVPQEQLAAALSKTHLFFLTHNETLGITALEAAMSGCLIVSPPSLLTADRFDTIEHVLVDHNAPLDWEDVLSKANPIKCRQVAEQNSFSNMINSVLEGLRYNESV